MKDNVFFLICQVFVRDISAHAHCPADVLHKRPHKCVPWRDRPFIYGKVLIRNECGFVDCTNSTGAIASPACALTIECQLFGARRIEMFSAHRTDKVLSCRHP